MKRLRLTLLGDFALSMDDGQRIAVSSRKGRALFAYLALQPHFRAGRDAVATLLWEAGSDQKARQSLRQDMLRLRADLGEAAAILVSDAETIALSAADISVDARDFLEMAQANNDANLADAVALYAGPLLAHLSLKGEAFEEWLQFQRQHVSAVADRIFERQVHALDAVDAGEAAITLAERLLAFDPLREDRHRIVLRLYAKYRGRDAASARAKTLAELLKAELRVMPDPETRAMLVDIAQGKFGNPKIIPAEPALVHSIAPLDTLATLARDEDMAFVPAITPQRSPQMSVARFGLIVVMGGAVAALALQLSRGPFVDAVAGGPKVVQGGRPGVNWNSPPVAGQTAAARNKSGRIVSLLVLPFANRNPADKSATIAADILTDDLINQLSFANGVRVISSKTARFYGTGSFDPSEVGRNLGVGYVLEGNVTVQEEKVRANVSLIDPASRLTIWAERIERHRGDESAILDDIVARLARELHIEIATAEGERAARHPGAPGSFTSRGYASLFKGHTQPDKLAESARLFRAALRENPDDTDAQIGLAAGILSASAEIESHDRKASFDEARALLQRALAARPNSAAVHLHLGRLQRMTGELDNALASFARVLDLQPSNVQAHAQIGRVLSIMGRPSEALAQFRYAIQLSPKDSALAYWTRFIGEAELELKNYDEAVIAMEKAVELAPKQSRPWGVLAAAYALSGRSQDAERSIAALRERVPGVTTTELMQTFAPMKNGVTTRQMLAEGLRLALAAADNPSSHR